MRKVAPQAIDETLLYEVIDVLSELDHHLNQFGLTLFVILKVFYKRFVKIRPE